MRLLTLRGRRLACLIGLVLFVGAVDGRPVAADEPTPQGRVAFFAGSGPHAYERAGRSTSDWSLYVMRGDGSGVRRLVSEVVPDPPPVPSPDGSRVVLRSVPLGLCIVDIRASSSCRSLRDKNVVFAPSWSPDGRRLAFASSLGGGSHIAIIEMNGGARRRIADDGARKRGAAWSPDGRWIAYLTPAVASGSTEYQLRLIDPDGAMMRDVADGLDARTTPAWSPDGSMLAFVSRHGLQVYAVSEAAPRTLAVTAPAPPGVAPEALPIVVGVKFAWSPDARRIALENQRDIVAVPVDGGVPTRQTRGETAGIITIPYVYSFPAWSPDGRWLSYVRSRLKEQEIFVISADGRTQRQLTRSADGKRFPVWIPGAGD
jgi:TolB protein